MTFRSGTVSIDLPTMGLAFGIYLSFGLLTWFHNALPWWVIAPLGGYIIALHGSLQHEATHGFPSREAWIYRADRLPLALALAALQRLSRRPSGPSPRREPDLPFDRSGIELPDAHDLGGHGTLPPARPACPHHFGGPAHHRPALCRLARRPLSAGRHPGRRPQLSRPLAASSAGRGGGSGLGPGGLPYPALAVSPALCLSRPVADPAALLCRASGRPSGRRAHRHGARQSRCWPSSTLSTISMRSITPSRRPPGTAGPPATACARPSSTRPMAATSSPAMASSSGAISSPARSRPVHPFAGQGFPL